MRKYNFLMRKYKFTMWRYKIKYIMRKVNLHRANVNSQEKGWFRCVINFIKHLNVFLSINNKYWEMNKI